MVTTEIELPEELHERVKRICERERISIGEFGRRAIVSLADATRSKPATASDWKWPEFSADLLVPLEDLKDISRSEEELHAILKVMPDYPH